MSRFTKTLDPCRPVDSRQMELPGLTLSRQGFPARTSVRLVVKRALMASVRDCGPKSLGSLASFDRVSRSWRTAQSCLVEGWAEFSETWPRSGTMRSGIAYRLPTLAPLNAEIGSGLLPTLIAGDGKGGRNGTAKGRSLSSGLTLTDWLWLEVGPGMLDPGSGERMMGFPIGHTDLPRSAMLSSRKSRS